MINTKLQSIIDTKSAIGNAIVNKGGTITSETPFFNYAAQIDGISTGTPQTIFQASDGSKWALTNAVNLVNDAGNVTHDFNYWQPANNSTSDPILNVGTVNGNISGNIKIVQVNQVNITQYDNIVATDTLGGKYVGFNGFDAITNPTPTGNTTFNRWLLNNSATGTVVFANATFTTGTYNGPNSSLNQSDLPFVSNSASYGGDIFSTTINDGFIYAGGGTTNVVRKYNESSFSVVGNTANYGGPIFSITTNNGFIYAGGGALTGTNRGVSKFHESNLIRVGNTVNYGGSILSVTTNNGFIYAGGDGNRTVQKFYESNLVFVGNTNDYFAPITAIAINNGFIYAAGETEGKIQKYHESNLIFVNNSSVYGGDILNITINNGFIYAGGDGNQTVQKFHESNLVRVGNTANYDGTIRSITINNGFIYAGGSDTRTARKYHESNLVFLAETNSYGATIRSLQINNGFIFAAGDGNATANRNVKKYQEAGLTPDNQTFYTATKIKE